MPSSSHAVAFSGWKTISSWIVYLTLSLIAVPALASDLPNPDISPDQEPESSSESQPDLNLESSQLSAHADRLLGRLARIDRVETPANLQHSPVHPAEPALQPVAASPVDATWSGIPPTAPADSLAQTTTPEAETTAESVGAGTEAGAVTEVTVTSEDCLADCDPGERFNFNAPTNIAIPPRSTYQRPFLAERPPLPVPAPPTASPGTVPSPPPLSTPQPVQPEEPAVAEAPSAPNPTDETVGTSSRALTPPSLQFQGVYIYQGDEDAVRFRVTGVYPILPELQVGATLDFTEGDLFSTDEDDGFQINELYVAASIPDYPNLRFIVGQIDLTSYFDRNSFAKDSATQFFNPLFATNPALAAAGIGSRQGAVVNWTPIDEVEVKAAVFSSDRSISDFELNGFASEIGARLGNLIVRGTYATAEDAGANTSFEEAFRIERSNGEFGVRDGDREDGYGVNAEYFIPEINLGLFARYGWYENRDLGRGGSTYNFGINLLDLFMEGDRLGLGYGQELSDGDDSADVFEAFYDFRIFDSLRLGVTFQGFDGFSESIAGFRIRTDFDLVPRRN
jgi:hypothetical protein